MNDPCPFFSDTAATHQRTMLLRPHGESVHLEKKGGKKEKFAKRMGQRARRVAQTERRMWGISSLWWFVASEISERRLWLCISPLGPLLYFFFVIHAGHGDALWPGPT
nr:hypothetical protein [Pandoravirus massiliensis]